MTIGSISAIAQGFDALAFLGAEHWFEADHLQRLVELHEQTGTAVCTAARNLVDLEGQLLGRCFEADGQKFADINSLFLTRQAFGLIGAWPRIPSALAPIGDRVIWNGIRDAKLSRSHKTKPTVNFRTLFASALYLF